jgi:uncharacterized protein
MFLLKHRWLLALPLIGGVMIGTAAASSIQDEARLFSPDAVREAEAKLKDVERETSVTTTIETIPSLDGRSINEAAVERARATRTEGLFILIPKQEHRIWVLASQHYNRAINPARRQAIEGAFVDSFKRRDFDAGLKDGVQAIARELAAAQAETGGRLRQANAPRPVARPGGGSFGLGTLLGIGLLIVAVLIGVRMLGALFGGGRGAYGPGMGRPDMGPGYGGPGYGGRGGGFFSSLLGGIGGAMAGNWLYDQFSGRHHGGTYADNTSYAPGSEAAPTTGGDEWGGGAGTGGDWGGGDSGGDPGGGDWGGGGGDWGGGGGDWGGGGDGGSW